MPEAMPAGCLDSDPVVRYLRDQPRKYAPPTCYNGRMGSLILGIGWRAVDDVHSERLQSKDLFEQRFPYANDAGDQI